MRNIVSVLNFVQATRDSGYKGLSYAVAEVIDNSLDASASTVHVVLRTDGDNGGLVVVRDNGRGMSRDELQKALAFGWSSRFNGRDSMGRYGMGLPNSAFSQSRKVEVYSWQQRGVIYKVYLDLDEIVDGEVESIPGVRRVTPDSVPSKVNTKSGTVVVWSKCDRADFPIREGMVEHLRRILGRVYRHHLWTEKVILINGAPLRPVDPLMLRECPIEPAASQYGEKLVFNVGRETTARKIEHSPIEVCFSCLPIKSWHGLSNREKKDIGITRGGGVSVVRANREIDIGWHFMGTKRRENYDDWWRCEIKFEPDLDELFGITHTKQQIHPKGILESILTPDLSSIARTLNFKVRQQHNEIRRSTSVAIRTAVAADRFFPSLGRKHRRGRESYSIENAALDDESFYLPKRSGRSTTLVLNTNHGFFSRCYQPLKQAKDGIGRNAATALELILLALSRTELSHDKMGRRLLTQARKQCGNILEAFLREYR